MVKIRPAAGGGTIVEVEPERLRRWVENFAARNGGIAAHHAQGDAWTIEANEGAPAGPGEPVSRTSAQVQWALAGGLPAGWLLDDDPLVAAERLSAYALEPRVIAVLLARKGAYSVGVLDDGRILASKTDTAYVQGKTKAGGQSQQRFARRREGQAHAAEKRARDAVVAVLGGARFDALVTGGVVDGILDDPRLAHLRAAVHFGDIAEPKQSLLTATAYRAIGFRVRIVPGAADLYSGVPASSTKDAALRTSPARAILLATAVQLARFGLIVGALAIAPDLGIHGWYQGLFANAVCALFAIAVVTRLRLWRRSGLFALRRSGRAALLLLPFVFEALVWLAYPGGFGPLAPGYGLWALTLLLVGVNEELTSRVAVLESLRTAFSSRWAVLIAGVMFGLQHLSLLATGDPSTEDVVTILVLTSIYGIALGAYQVRFAWVLPLVLVHAASDFTQILTADPVPFAMHAVLSLGLLAFGLRLLAGRREGPTGAALVPPWRGPVAGRT
ncbi:acVLRF1 family peptidyl-tRNA hydrolase [Glycomyces terrestris]|uniref:acVLRF1 family peptidyl-tRNA hydrolase n=1 Tax=Glycomyces terrestris TaxID=2493553 RepID=UPI0013157E76|nr:acVLRF1 family peptidyl-tRNA hydrolase [Glycomyces terrestris]